MTEGRRKKLHNLEGRLEDITGELVDLMARETDAGGDKAEQLEDVVKILRYSDNLMKQIEQGVAK